MRLKVAISNLVLLILLLWSVPTSAGKIEKAFEALKIYDYFQARELFKKSLKSNPSAAAYGLSLICSNDKNPFYQLDSALKTRAITQLKYSTSWVSKLQT